MSGAWPCCGRPSTAAWYAHAVVSRPVPGGTETSSVDRYACADHKPTRADLAPPPPWKIIEFACRPVPQGGPRA